MKYCTNCGCQLADNMIICPNCGCRADAQPAQDNAATVMFSAASAPAASGYAAAPAAPAASGYAPAPAAPAASGYAPAPAAPGYVPAPGYAPAAPGYVPGRPVRQLKTNRGLVKFILLSLITFGIYGLVVMSAVSSDINIIAGRYDGKKTMHFCLVTFIFSWLTLGIVPLVWYHRICKRIGAELTRRGVNYSFGAGTFWGWGILGSFIFVGPYIFYHKLLKSMNLLAGHYNIYG